MDRRYRFVRLLQCSVQTSPDKETAVPFQPPIQEPGHAAGASLPEELSASITPHNHLSRRSLLLATPTLLGATALSYARVVGANERIRLGHVGVGNRGRELASVVGGLK